MSGYKSVFYKYIKNRTGCKVLSGLLPLKIHTLQLLQVLVRNPQHTAPPKLSGIPRTHKIERTLFPPRCKCNLHFCRARYIARQVEPMSFIFVKCDISMFQHQVHHGNAALDRMLYKFFCLSGFRMPIQLFELQLHPRILRIAQKHPFKFIDAGKAADPRMDIPEHNLKKP